MLVKWVVFLGGGLKGDNSPRTNAPPFNLLPHYFVASFPFLHPWVQFLLSNGMNRKDTTDEGEHCTTEIHWKLFIVPHRYIDPNFGILNLKYDPTPSQKVVCRLRR